MQLEPPHSAGSADPPQCPQHPQHCGVSSCGVLVLPCHGLGEPQVRMRPRSLCPDLVPPDGGSWGHTVLQDPRAADAGGRALHPWQFGGMRWQ